MDENLKGTVIDLGETKAGITKHEDGSYTAYL
jgi:hypothetical protein